MPYLTVSIAPKGATIVSEPKTGQPGESMAGHGWFVISQDDGTGIHSYGLAPKAEYEGRPVAPGDIYNDDYYNYQSNDHAAIASFKVYISHNDYEELMNYADKVEDSSPLYTLPLNNCIKFLWDGLETIGIHFPVGMDRNMWPSSNIPPIIQALNQFAQQNGTLLEANANFTYDGANLVSCDLKDSVGNTIQKYSYGFNLDGTLASITIEDRKEQTTQRENFFYNNDGSYTHQIKSFNPYGMLDETTTTVNADGSWTEKSCDSLGNLTSYDNVKADGSYIEINNVYENGKLKSNDTIIIDADGNPVIPTTGPVTNYFNLTTITSGTAEQSVAGDGRRVINNNNVSYNNLSIIQSLLGTDVNTDQGNKAWANYGLTDFLRPGNNNTYNVSMMSMMNLDFFQVDPALAAAGANTATNWQSWKLAPADPLVLDLNGDGVKLTDYGNDPVLFDADHDGGYREQTGWVSRQDGILVYDTNGNGKIDDISETLSEYFGGTAGTGGAAGTKPFTNGFTALKSLDTGNGTPGSVGYNDNQFTNADAAWSNVKVWVDANHDGKSWIDTDNDGVKDTGETTELKTLNELGITQINLTTTSQSGLMNNGNEVLASGTFMQWVDASGNPVAGKDRGRTSKYQNNLQCDYAGELIY